VIFPVAAVTLTVVLNGTALRSYNAPYIANGHVQAPLEPYVTAFAQSLGYDGKSLIVRSGDLFAQIPLKQAPQPQHYAATYVELAPLVRTLGGRVAWNGRLRVLYVRMPEPPLATPTPFNPAVPLVAPAMVFTPTPAQTPRPQVTGTPLPRRTPLPVQPPLNPAHPSPTPAPRAKAAQSRR
jgi:hypothetical protein